MLIRDRIVVVTGAARGIGAALARRFSHEGARAVVLADLDRTVDELAREIGGMAVVADVGLQSDVQRIVDTAVEASEPVRALLNAEALDPDAVADVAVQGIADERFLILPHPQVADFLRRKADDYDRWLRGMRRLQHNIESS